MKIIVAFCMLVLSSIGLGLEVGKPYHGGVKATNWWPTNQGGIVQYHLSKTDEAVFSKITFTENGHAGFTHIWINGIPWVVPVFYANMDTVAEAYPWYVYPINKE